MTAHVIKRFNSAGLATNHDDAFAGDVAEEIIAGMRDVIRASRTDPVFEKENVELAAKKVRVRVVARRQCFPGNSAQNRLLWVWDQVGFDHKLNRMTIPAGALRGIIEQRKTRFARNLSREADTSGGPGGVPTANDRFSCRTTRVGGCAGSGRCGSSTPGWYPSARLVVARRAWRRRMRHGD